MQHSYLSLIPSRTVAKKLAASIMFLSLIALSVPQGAFADEDSTGTPPDTNVSQGESHEHGPPTCADLGEVGTFPHCTPPQPEPSCTIVSDTSTLQNGQPSVLVSPIHSAWTSLLNGGSWIWGENPIADAVNQTSETFTKTFNLSNDASTASITVAADNSYTLSVNGHLINADTGEFNYTAAGQDTIPVPGSYLVAGTNVITATVTNFAQPGGTMASNPAGLLFTLTVNGATCTTPPPPPAHVTVQATKVVCDSEADLPNWGTGGHVIDANTATQYVHDHPGCHLQHGWSFEWGNANAGDAGDSHIGPAGNGYVTFGPTGEDGTATVSIPSEGLSELHMREILQEGFIPFTHAAHPDNSDTVSAEFYCANDALNYDNWDFIRTVQAGQKYYCVAFNAPVQPETPPTKLKVHVFKYLVNDDGQEAQVPNDSSAPAFPMIATYSIAGVGTNLNPGDSYVLGNGGGTAGSDGNLKYAANTIPLSVGDTYGTHEVTGGDSVVAADQESCTVGKYYLEGYRVGTTLEAAQKAELSDTAPNFSEISQDEYVIVVNSPCPDDTIIPETPPGGGGGGGGGTHFSGGGPGLKKGLVLGAATTTEPDCVPILTSYLRLGHKNPVDQVKILQNFLNGELSLHLPVSGHFGPMTKKGVEAFQAKYFTDVLTPWVPHGLPNEHAVTGYVYKTTQRKVNLVACSTLDIPLPKLP